MERRKPGRPPLGRRDASANLVIAQTVHTLANWGFSVRTVASPGVAEVVGVLAFRILKRASSQGGPLCERQIKRIYEGWLGDPIARWAHSSAHYPVAWRRRWRPLPKASLEQLAERLLRNGGVWPREAVTISGHAGLAAQISASAWIASRPPATIPDLTSEGWAEEDTSPTLNIAPAGRGWATGRDGPQ